MPTDQTQLKITSAEEWDDVPVPVEEGFPVELPSGRVVKARRTLDLPVLLQTGQIPNPLAKIVRKMMHDKTGDFPVDEMDDTVLTQLLGLLQACAVKTVLEPQLSMPEKKRSDETQDEFLDRCNAWVAPPGTVSIFRVDLPDLMYLFAVSQGMAADLASFRAEQTPTVVSAQPQPAVPNKAKRARKRT